MQTLDSCRNAFQSFKIMTSPGMFIYECFICCGKYEQSYTNLDHYHSSEISNEYSIKNRKSPNYFEKKSSYIGAKLLIMSPVKS